MQINKHIYAAYTHHMKCIVKRPTGYELILECPLVIFMFQSVSCDFKRLCKLVKFEYINENGQTEFESVHYFLRTALVIDTNNRESFSVGWVVHTLVEFIKLLQVIFTRNDKLKLMAYTKYKFFFKSVILYGVDVEKVIFLDCLKQFMINVNEIKRDVFDDTVLIENLKGIVQKDMESSDRIKIRLNETILNFLKIKFDD